MEEPPQQSLKHPRGEELEASATPESLSRPISPPRKRRRGNVRLKSPWQLTWIRDLPEEMNRDAVTLSDILGDPLITECWEFNYLHDIHFLMDAFDKDVRDLVRVHVVHGFWKREDQGRIAIAEDAADFKNVAVHVAPMPEMFGTHHSKMMILFRNDDTAQVVIHTANMIAKDWTNMTNAVWQSPLLPKMTRPPGSTPQAYENLAVGSGVRFKHDLLSYLRAYEVRRDTCRALIDKLREHDFSTIKAALIASVPGRHQVHEMTQPAWGWNALKRTLKAVPCSPTKPEIVVQISSIATLGPSDQWLQKTLFQSLSASKNVKAARPEFKVVFPTPDEIRRSLDGYVSGASIHTKIQSSQQAKQLQYLRPILHHWANDAKEGAVLADEVLTANGGRNRASPHIKTYIRYAQGSQGAQGNVIDWALLTSANLSKQAWGEAAQPSGEARIASWEIGVMVWPDLLHKEAVMMSTFQEDMPGEIDPGEGEGEGEESTANVNRATGAGAGAVIGLRVPYSVPLQRYGSNEVPWVATMSYSEPDNLGGVWGPRTQS